MNTPQPRKSPAATGLNRNYIEAHDTTNPAQVLLPRLERARKYGDGWRADCPVGHKSHGTLSVRETSDGTLLVRCWAGCETLDVLRMVGLELHDLFSARIKDQSPMGRRQRRDAWGMAGWRAALNVLGREATVIEVAAHDMSKAGDLGESDHARLLLACRRIHDAREVLA